jgi:hypothetical protein
MTGYLYRKALSVLQPGTSIHPIVRPMFSESGQQQPVDASLFTREATGYASPAGVEPAPAAPMSLASAPGEDDFSLPEHTEPRVERHEPGSEPAPPDSTGLRPSSLAPADWSPLPSERHQATEATHVPASSFPASPEGRQASPATHMPANSSPVLPDRGKATGATQISATSVLAERRQCDAGIAARAALGSTQPATVTGSFNASEPIVPAPQSAPSQRLSAVLTPRQPTDERVDPPQVGVHRRPAASRTRPARETEEVQIHIGRIEVTATPSEPPRPAAVRPQRKAIPLGEYLTRRDGGI